MYVADDALAVQAIYLRLRGEGLIQIGCHRLSEAKLWTRFQVMFITLPVSKQGYLMRSSCSRQSIEYRLSTW